VTWLDPFTRLSTLSDNLDSSRLSRARLTLEELQQRLVPALVVPSSLSGYVYCETCTCGAVNPSEAPISGVTISLMGTDSTDGSAVNLTTTTNSAGLYSFQNLDPGTYTITEIVPTGYTADKTTQGTPGNGTVSPGVIADISLASGVNGTNNDFGDICPTVPPPPPPPPTGSLCGTVYSYCSGMSGETGIQGVTVTLTGPGGTRTATTDSHGHYAFTDLVAGTYTITETPPAGYTQGTTTAGTPTDGVANGDMISYISVNGTALTNYNFGEISPNCGCDHKPPTCDHDKDTCGDDKDHHSTCDNGDHDKDHSGCDNGDHDKDHQGGCDNGDHDKDHSTCGGDNDKDHSTCGGDNDKDHSTCGDNDKNHQGGCDNGDHDKDHVTCGGDDKDHHSTCGNGDDKDHSSCGGDDKGHATCDNGGDKDHQPTCNTGDNDKDHSACNTGDHDKGHQGGCDNSKDSFTTCNKDDHSNDSHGSTCAPKPLHC